MRPAHSKRGRAGAFTLLEIMIAMTIFTFVMVAIYSAWSAILRGARSGSKAAAEVQRARIAIRSLEESLGSAVLYADNPKYYSFFADTSGEYSYLSFVARLPESFPGGGMFAGQNMRRVSFFVDDKKQLSLAQTPIMEAAGMIEKPYTIILAPQVSTFAVEFFNARGNEWVPEWPYTNQIPALVRMAIGFGGEAHGGVKSAQRVTMRVIPMNSTPITRAGSRGGPIPGQRGPIQPPPGGGGIGFEGGDENLGWQPRLPRTFGGSSGSSSRNPIFP